MLSKIILFATLLISVSIFAQKSGDDIVILKSGEKIYGKIIERTEGVSVKIETTKKSVRIEAWTDIDKITKQDPEAVNWQKQLRVHDQLRHVKAKGFASELSILGISRIDNSNYYSINASFGYQFNPYFALMAGGGGEVTFKKQFVPVFAQVRINFLPRTYTPFFFANVGYAFGFRDPIYDYSNGYNETRKTINGAYLNTGIGFKYMPRKHFGFNLKAGFRLQHQESGVETVDTYYGSYKVRTAASLLTGFNVSTALEF